MVSFLPVWSGAPNHGAVEQSNGRSGSLTPDIHCLVGKKGVGVQLTWSWELNLTLITLGNAAFLVESG